MLVSREELSVAEDVIRMARRIVRRSGHTVEQFTDVSKLVFRDARLEITVTDPTWSTAELLLVFDGLKLTAIVVCLVNWAGSVSLIKKSETGSIIDQLAAIRNYLIQLSVLDDLADL